MSEELVKIESGLPAIQNPESAFAVDFSQIQRIKPITLSIDQPMSEKEGVQPGMIRVLETGQLRKEVKIVLLEKPRSSRKYQIGKYPNSTTVCFSRDMIKPHPESQSMQAMACSGCKHASWERYNKSHKIEDAPACQVTDRIVAIDYDNLTPAQMYIRGKSRTSGFDDGMQIVIQNLAQLQMKNGSVSWVDVALTLTTEKYKGNPNYGLKIKSVHPLTPEEKKYLLPIITLIAGQKAALLKRMEEQEAASAGQEAEDSVTNAVAEAVSTPSAPVDGEYMEAKGNVEEV